MFFDVRRNYKILLIPYISLTPNDTLGPLVSLTIVLFLGLFKFVIALKTLFLDVKTDFYGLWFEYLFTSSVVQRKLHE
jgi:hypothetical protein